MQYVPYKDSQYRLSAILHSRYLLSLREAFIALIPYFVSSALAILVLNSALFFNIITIEHPFYDTVLSSASLVLALFPVVETISIGYFVSKNFGQSGIVGALLALLCFSLHGNYIIQGSEQFTINPTGATPYAIVIPSISSFLLTVSLKWQPRFQQYQHRMSRFLKEKMIIILPFTLTFFSFYLFMPLLDSIGNYIAVWLTPDDVNSSIAELTFQRMLITHTF